MHLNQVSTTRCVHGRRADARAPRVGPGVVLFLALCLSGCSSQQLYGAGQAWQRNECHKIIDAQEYRRCLASTSMSYDEYRRRIEADKGAL